MMITFITDFTAYFNINDLNNYTFNSYDKNIEIYNPFELFENHVEKIQIMNNNQINETIYLDETKKDTITSTIYFKDGLNILKIILVDKNDNKQISSDIIVNINTKPYEQDNHNLLTNFVANDDDMIELCVGNANLEYEDQYVGNDKKVDINLDIPSNYFKLIGVNSDLYQISKDNIPNIKSTISPRPLGISFNDVSKIYDGTCDITNEVNKLVLNNGYKFVDVSTGSNDFSNSGFVNEIFESNNIKAILNKKDDILEDVISIDSSNINFDTLIITIDNMKLKPNINNDIIEYSFDDYLSEYNQTPYVENTGKRILEGKCRPKKSELCYFTKTIQKLDGNNIIKYVGLDLRGCYDVNDNLINDPIIYESENETDVINWLRYPDHKLIKIQLEIDSKNNITKLKTIYVPNVNKYVIKDNMIIEYNHIDSNKSKFVYVESDCGFVKANYDTAYFENKNVEDTKKIIHLTNLRLEGDEKGDRSNNYQIASYSINGNIIKREIEAYVKFEDKIYDGTTNVTVIADDSNYVNGLKNIISLDDINIDTNKSIFYFESPDVNEAQLIKTGNLVLKGKDINNYTLTGINNINEFKAKISKRSIKIKINRIRLYRSDLRWDVDYEFDDAISSDNLTIDIKQIKFFARKLNEDSNVDVYDNIEVIPNYFTYDHSKSYKFEIIDDEIKLVNNWPKTLPENKKVYYSIDEKIPNNKNRDRFNINNKYNTNYTGNVMLSTNKIIDRYKLNKSFIGEIENIKIIENIITSYYESKNQDNKIYSGCKVKLTDIHLDDSNSKSKNYILENMEAKTILEII